MELTGAEARLWELANHPEAVQAAAPEASPQGIWAAMAEVRMSLDQGSSAHEAIAAAEAVTGDMPVRERRSALLALLVARRELTETRKGLLRHLATSRTPPPTGY